MSYPNLSRWQLVFPFKLGGADQLHLMRLPRSLLEEKILALPLSLDFHLM